MNNAFLNVRSSSLHNLWSDQVSILLSENEAQVVLESSQITQSFEAAHSSLLRERYVGTRPIKYFITQAQQREIDQFACLQGHILVDSGSLDLYKVSVADLTGGTFL